MNKRYSGPQIVAKLRQADKLLGQGKTVEEVCKEINVTDATYYRWHICGPGRDRASCRYVSDKNSKQSFHCSEAECSLNHFFSISNIASAKALPAWT